jgi:hypothetical protein
MSKLPPSYDAKLDEPEEPIPPHMETLPWTFAGRGRGALFGLAVLGVVAFFMPWLHEKAPELRDLSGFAFAQKLGWLWAAGIAPFVLAPLVATRRSIFRMRGARVAIAFLAVIMLLTVGMRMGVVPHSSSIRPVRFEWGWGMYASGLIAIAILAMAPFFGGRLDDIPTKQKRRGDETLH